MSNEKKVSRSQLFDNDNDNNVELNDNNEEYNLPPPGFDFEIVDIEDNDTDDKLKYVESKTKEKEEEIEEEEKIEFFPLFSTSSSTTTTNHDNQESTKTNLVKIKIDNNDDEVNTIDEIDTLLLGKSNISDQDWDRMVNEFNLDHRPLSYYYDNTDNDSNDKIQKYKSVAINGEDVIRLSQYFRIISDYKVINLKEYNSKIDLYYSIPKAKKSNKRSSRKKRDAKIFKKERLQEWNSKLKEINECSKNMTIRDYSKDSKTSKKIIFDDEWKKSLQQKFSKKPNYNKSHKSIHKTK